MVLLSPKSRTIYDRLNRPSFQGLAVIEGNGRNKEYDESNKITTAAKFKTERRRRQTLDKMKLGAQSDQVRQIFDSAMDNCVSTRHFPGDLEDRLQAIMTKAKEKGMTTDNIFNFFNGGSSNATHITKQSFLRGLEKLGDTFLIVSDEELSILVRKIVKSGNDEISIAEFKNYCYSEINSVPWKAERNRMERSGEMKKLKEQISRKVKLVKPCDLPNQHRCGEEVYHTSKVFWRTNDNVDIKLYYCSSLDVITMQLFSLTINEELPAIYVSKHQVDYGRSSSPEIENDERESVVSWDAIAKFLVARLQLNASHGEIPKESAIPIIDCSHGMPGKVVYKPYLRNLTGDKFDNLMMKKPLNLDSPPISSGNSSTLDNFKETMVSFQKVSRSARSSRKSAQELNSLVNSALSEVQSMVIHNKSTWR